MEPQSQPQQKWQEPKNEQKKLNDAEPPPAPHQLQRMRNHLESSAHLGDGTEVEDTLVFEAGQVGEDVGDVVEGVGDELVQALHGHVNVLWLGKV